MRHRQLGTDIGRPWSAQQALLDKHLAADLMLLDIEMTLFRIRSQFVIHTMVAFGYGVLVGLALALF